MKFKEFIKKTMLEYFIITTCITLGMGILGVIFYPEQSFGYEAYFSPLFWGLLSLIPAIISYSSKELTGRQMLVRKLLHVLGIEILLNVVAWKIGMSVSVLDVVVLSTCIAGVFVVVTIFSWLALRRTASQINEGLRKLQNEVKG